MNSTNLINLHFLMARTSGSPKISIGLIDGPVNTKHPALINAKIREIPGNVSRGCVNKESIACTHGTFVAGMLAVKKRFHCTRHLSKLRFADSPSIC
jgi:hypothetical protein